MKHSIFFKNNFFSCAMLAAVLCAGCVKGGVVEPEEKTMTVLTADVQTKTMLQNDVNVLWTSGDRINVNGVESRGLELKEPSGSVSFTFD